MNNKIIVEIQELGTKKYKTQTFEKGEVTIGRSYDCDVIISDPFVDKKHAKISINSPNTKLSVSDLSSTNGTFIKKNKINNETAEIDSGSSIKIGKTTLRLFSNHHDIPKTKVFSLGTKLHDFMDNDLVAFVALAITMLLTSLSSLMSNSNPDEYFDNHTYLEDMFGALLAGLGLSMLLKLSLYFEKSKKTFSLCISYSCVVMVMITIFFFTIHPYLYFYVPSQIAASIVNISLLSLFFILISFFWTFLGNDKFLSKKTISSLFVIIAIMCVLNLKDITTFSEKPNYPNRITNAPIPSGILKTTNQFIKNSALLFQKLDNAN